MDEDVGSSRGNREMKKMTLIKAEIWNKTVRLTLPDSVPDACQESGRGNRWESLGQFFAPSH